MSASALHAHRPFVLYRALARPCPLCAFPLVSFSHIIGRAPKGAPQESFMSPGEAAERPA